MRGNAVPRRAIKSNTEYDNKVGNHDHEGTMRGKTGHGGIIRGNSVHRG